MSRKYIAAGFRQDMELLFSKFINNEQREDSSETQTETQSEPKEEPILRLRFRRFSEVWRELRFSLIFKGRLNDNELREFIDEIFLEVLPHLSSEKPFERRVASLYLLYGLYVNEPKKLSPKQNIRINYSYLEQIRELVSKAKQLEQFDVCYVWYKLLSIGAVHFVHVSRFMGPYYIRNSRVTSETETYTDFLINQFQESVLPSVDELSHIHEEYRIMKEALIEEKIEDMNTINQVEDNIFELCKAKMDNLRKEFANQNTVQETQPNDCVLIDEEHCDDVTALVSDDIGSRRRRIKDKAMAKNSTVSTTAEPSVRTAKVKGKRGRPKKSKIIQ